MKKFLLIILAIFFAMPMFSQSIAYRDENEESVLIASNFRLATSNNDRGLLADNLKCGVCLTICDYKNPNLEDVRYLGVLYQTREKCFSQKGSKLIIKTFKGDCITLAQYTFDADSREGRKENYEGSRILYDAQADYEISDEDLQTLLTDGIQWVRVETTIGLIDFIYKKNDLGKELVAINDLLLSKLNLDSDF